LHGDLAALLDSRRDCARKPVEKSASIITESIPLIVTSTGSEVRLAQLEMSVDGQSSRFLLDTGAASSSLAVDDHTKHYSSLGIDKSKGVSGKAEQCDIVQPNEIRLGHHVSPGRESNGATRISSESTWSAT